MLLYKYSTQFLEKTGKGNIRVIILNRGSMPCKKTGGKWCNSSRPQCTTSLDTARSLANGPSWGGWERCILRSPGIAASPVSFLSMGGACGRSLTAEKILFTGRQTCSLYLVLWLWKILPLQRVQIESSYVFCRQYIGVQIKRKLKNAIISMKW